MENNQTSSVSDLAWNDPRLPAAIAAETAEKHAAESSGLSPEAEAYFAPQVAAMREAREVAAAKNDPVHRAIANFKSEVDANNVTNIHQARDLKLDVEGAKRQLESEPPAFDATNLENALGLNIGAMAKLGVDNEATATEAARGLAHACAQSTTSEEVKEHLQQWADIPEAQPALELLKKRTLAEIDNWSSVRYGQATTRTADQTVECHKLWDHALRQSLALSKNNLKSVPIEKLLVRARLALDDGFAISTQKQSRQSSSQPDPSLPNNIHAALLRNPTF